MKAAAADGAAVVLFPEATMACFGTSLGPLAEPLDGPWASAVREIATAHDVLVVAGMFTPAPDGRVYNTLLATGRDQHVGYDKIHLFDAFGFQESRTVAPGRGPRGARRTVGSRPVTTCGSPGCSRGWRTEGASVVLLGASWGAGPGKRRAVGAAGAGTGAGLDVLGGGVWAGRPWRAVHGADGHRAQHGRRRRTVRCSRRRARTRSCWSWTWTWTWCEKTRETIPVLANRRL